MAEVTKVSEKYEQVERVITEDILVRPQGYELFLTEEEMLGLRTLLGLGTTGKVLEVLKLEGLWNTLHEKFRPDWSVSMTPAKVND
jgi:hypothetical protein